VTNSRKAEEFSALFSLLANVTLKVSRKEAVLGGQRVMQFLEVGGT